ncbi:MAG: hypothetical protein ACOVP2_10110 [Armatimonadaceae bacterium]
MVLEAPLFSSTIAGLPDAARQLRAWGLTMQLSLCIESPVIMLLASSLAFVHSAETYAVTRKLTIVLCWYCTFLTFLVGWTPLLDIVAHDWLGFPLETVDASRVPLRIMLLWSAAIGWRRFLQGILIHQGQAQRLVHGTVLRLASILVTTVALAKLTNIGGAAIAATAIMVGVLLESVYVTVVSIPSVTAVTKSKCHSDAKELMWKLVRFHTPLAATSLMGLIVQPVVSQFLAGRPDSYVSLAVWPVLFGIVLELRGWGISVQELAVGRLKHKQSTERGVWMFALLIGLLTSATVLLICIVPALMNSIEKILNLDGRNAEIRTALESALPWCVGLPLSTSLLSAHRGILAYKKQSVLVSAGMVVSVVSLIGCLWIARNSHFPALPTACVVLLVSEIVSILVQLIPMRSRA